MSERAKAVLALHEERKRQRERERLLEILQIDKLMDEVADKVYEMILRRVMQKIRVGGGGARGVTDHGFLQGLLDDDHTQYYNAARHTKAIHIALGLFPKDGSEAMTGDFDLAGNKLLTTNLLLKEFSASTFAIRNRADTDYRDLYLRTLVSLGNLVLGNAKYFGTSTKWNGNYLYFRAFNNEVSTEVARIINANPSGYMEISQAGDITHYNGASYVRMATGTYEGDGNATQAITGVCFQPKVAEIYNQGATSKDFAVKTDQDGLFTKYGDFVAHVWNYEVDHIISLDADGFTVGDGTGSANVFNANGVPYTYKCLG